MEILINLGVFLILIGLGYFFGRYNENRHYRMIRIEEEALKNLPALANVPEEILQKAQGAILVTGSVVIAMDYFKRMAGGLRKLFGGRIEVYETLMDRARREAIIRMKKHALEAKGKVIVNTRLGTSTIGFHPRRQKMGCIEVFAYGTAIWWP